jgi:hypothetical protein
MASFSLFTKKSLIFSPLLHGVKWKYSLLFLINCTFLLLNEIACSMQSHRSRNRSNNYSRRSRRLNANEALLRNIGAYEDHLFQVLSWHCPLAIYTLVVLSCPRSSCFLNCDSADLEYLFPRLCCKQYKSGIDWFMCVILRFGLSVFVCFVFPRVGLGLVNVKCTFPWCLKFPLCVLLEILFW